MDTNQNNMQVNSFVRGMNSDTSYDMIGADQYLFGQNVRITNNTLIFSNPTSNTGEGVLAPIANAELQQIEREVNDTGFYTKILAVASVDDVGAIIVEKDSTTLFNEPHNFSWCVYKATLNDGYVNLERVFEHEYSYDERRESFSAVLYREQSDVLNLYIADGVHPIIQINLDGDGELNTDVDYLISNRLMPTSRLQMQKTSGRLKTQQLQYTYRFYKKHGTTTKLAPLTNKIQVIDSNRNKEQGNAEDTRTSLGFELTLDTSTWNQHYDHLQVFRVSYIKANEVPEVYLIHDDRITGDSTSIIDKGDEELAQYSLDEFKALESQIIVPQSIEQNQGYLFAANIKDESTFYVDPEEVGDNSVTLVTTEVPIANVSQASDPQPLQIKELGGTNVKTINEYFAQHGMQIQYSNVQYNDMIGSSMLRSLRRGESYRYGVVYYDKYGAKSNVIRIGDVNTGSSNIVELSNNVLYAKPLGVKLDIFFPEGRNIVGYQIVRCEKTDQYTTNILQVALSRPVHQTNYNRYTPFYPNTYLTTQFTRGWYEFNSSFHLGNQTNSDNYSVYQAFSPEINIARIDTVSALTSDSIKMQSIRYAYENVGLNVFSQHVGSGGAITYRYIADGTFDSSDLFYQHRGSEDWDKPGKAERGSVVNLYSASALNNEDLIQIQNVEDVKNPRWDQGFSNVQLGGSTSDVVQSAIKQYKSFKTVIGTESYVNWAANGMYDLRTTENEVQTGANETDYVFYGTTESDLNNEEQLRGWIGPGPVCLLLYAKDVPTDSALRKQQGVPPNPTTINQTLDATFGSIIANIRHEALSYNDKYTPYYGFGNYFDIPDPNETDETESIVFDGDIYITPAEFVNIFKTYDFNQKATTLISGQLVYYIPLESRINTFFDYGMNYRNTNSTNLMLEPGEITGIASQGRPLHQYNMVYSDNNTSIDVFTPQTREDAEQESQYQQRICYSQLKTNGENIDNWQIFRPADFIDVDSQHGEVTHLLSADNTLYYWQNTAFGKLSVNERSLVKDENSNTIQLGQGGVLNRYDYLSTRYGMRKDDRAAISAERGIYWIDINNKAIPAFTNGVTNLAEIANVQNVVNHRMVDTRPNIQYDLQNYELLCKCLEDGEQLVFNLKLSTATSVYTRQYDDCLVLSNVIYGLRTISTTIYQQRLNYLENGEELSYMPTKIAFVVNSSPSITKVFDSQKVVTLRRNNWSAENTNYFENKEYSFETDLGNVSNYPMFKTDREGNIIYDIPRAKSNFNVKSEWGARMRGKWMKVTIEDNNPKQDYCISHIITKFRQSYS